MRRCLATLVCLVTWTIPALGHDLGVECHVRGDKLDVKAYYDDGTRSAGSKVRLLDAHENVVQEGRTNENGEWQCPRPPPGEYYVVVDDGQGHRRKVAVAISSAADGGQVNEGPTEQEFTAFPWLRLAIGLGGLLGFALLAWFLNTRKGERGVSKQG